MRGKAGLVVGLAVGYVLGSRAGRQRYEQIKSQALKVWNMEPVQKQVGKAKDFAKSSAMALPSTLWDSAVKVTKAATSKGTAGERLDAAAAIALVAAALAVGIAFASAMKTGSSWSLEKKTSSVPAAPKCES